LTPKDWEAVAEWLESFADDCRGFAETLQKLAALPDEDLS
jgi:hypothetical protein